MDRNIIYLLKPVNQFEDQGVNSKLGNAIHESAVSAVSQAYVYL